MRLVLLGKAPVLVMRQAGVRNTSNSAILDRRKFQQSRENLSKYVVNNNGICCKNTYKYKIVEEQVTSKSN